MTVKYGKIYVKDSQGNPIQFIPEGTVNPSTISSVASELISSGGYITTSEAAIIIADQISSGGYVTSSGTVASAGVADGLTSTADSGYVHISGAETISGTKTFANTISGTITSAIDASSLGGIAASGYVNTTSAQTITGAKTFSGGVTLNNCNINYTISSGGSGRIVVSGENADFIVGRDYPEYGAELYLRGRHSLAEGGTFALKTGGGNFKSLVGSGNGTLTWNGSAAVFSGGVFADTLTVTSGATVSGGMTVTGTISGTCTSATNASSATNATSLGGLAASNYVKTSTNQTIGGTKTFSSDIIITSTDGNLKKQSSAPASGTIGFCWHNTTSSIDMLYVHGWWNSDNAGVTIAARNTNDSNKYYAVSLRSHSSTTMVFEPTIAGLYLGRNATGYKWKQVIAESATISTSDEREKSNISTVPDDVLDAWGDVQWSQFQMDEAIAEKGEEKARQHTGLVAQRIDAVFRAHNLDISRYGLFCWDSWAAEPEERDENGNIISPAQEASDAYALRYEEALAMEAAYQRRRADRAEARITTLENRLNKIEEALSSLISHGE